MTGISRISIAALLFIATSFLLSPSPAYAYCDGRDEVGMLGVSQAASGQSATVRWLGSDPACNRTHYNVAWAGGSSYFQRQRPLTANEDTVGPLPAGIVYTVSIQACRTRFLASSKCSPWSSRKFVTCGIKDIPCGHPRLNGASPLTITSGAGLCLDVHAPDLGKTGAKVQVWGCNGSRQQTWVRDPGNGAIISLGGKCLDVQGAQVNSDGSTVWMWDCNHQVQQRWFPYSVPMVSPTGNFYRLNPIKNAGGRCLDVHAPDQFKNGARVQIWSCNNTMQQDWTIEEIP